MKSIEFPAYRAFMFATVPQLVRAYYQLGNMTYNVAIQNAIVEAEQIWDAIDVHILEVTKKLEHD